MVIGIDFDNTIVCYDDVFYSAAVERGLIPPEAGRGKSDVRNYLRAVGKEDAWTELQGVIYGPEMKRARPFPGVKDFMARCAVRNIEFFIISHRTRHPYIGPRHDLHSAARDWLRENGFSGRSPDLLDDEHIFFELKAEEKIARIASAGCTHFIDDLPEFLDRDDFPDGVEKILFDPSNLYERTTNLKSIGSWAEMAETIFGGAAT
ncbi:MAG TPA: hypothetical protein PLQ76_07010 [bacterium]|nr:hypothetical protein [bacterium]